MTTDPIQHLRELLAEAHPGQYPASKYKGFPSLALKAQRQAEDRLLTYVKHALPSLLDVAEAARQVERNDRISVVWEDHLIALSELRKALAKLEKKP